MYRYGTKGSKGARSGHNWVEHGRHCEMDDPGKEFHRMYRHNARADAKKQIQEQYEEYLNLDWYRVFLSCSEFCNCEMCYGEFDNETT